MRIILKSKRLFAFFLAFSLVFSGASLTFPPAAASSYQGADFTTGVLASRLDTIIDSGISEKVSPALPAVNGRFSSSRMYIVTFPDRSWSGYQCMAYAYAAYNFLFKQDTALAINKVFSSLEGKNSLTYSDLRSAGVKFGAYLRTTGNRDGSFHISNGHSLLILSYNESNIVTLEANRYNNSSQYIAEIRTRSWDSFNTLLRGSNRYVCSLLQPYDSVYDSLSATNSETSSIPNSTLQTPSITASTESGKWNITIPANYRLDCYASATASSPNGVYVRAKNEPYLIRATRKATLSDGSIRYCATFNDDDVYWFVRTGSMSEENLNEVQEKLFTIRFDANGGTVEMESKVVKDGAVCGTLPVPTREGYTFDGWYLTRNGSGRVTENSSLVSSTGERTIYARWSPVQEPEIYNVILDDNYMSCDRITVTNGERYGALPTPTRDGYTFDGWYTDSTGGTQITASTLVNLTGDQTLYAHWTAHQVAPEPEPEPEPKPEPTLGPWSEWSTTPVSATSTREVETRTVKISDAYTQYRYYRYVDGTGNNDCWCETYFKGLNRYSGIHLESTEWTQTPYREKGSHWSCGHCNGNHVGVDHTTSDGRDWWIEYLSPSGESYYWYETQTVPATYETQYRYRDIL